MSKQYVSRSILLGASLLLTLTACSEVPQPVGISANNVEGLALIKVQADSADNVRAWDGVVESIHQATLSAQTSGRVSELLVDVNDSVTQGTVLARLSNVEQISGQNRSQAALRNAQAQVTEAEADYRRMSEMFSKRLIARAQYDQSLARRNTALAQLDSARAGLRESTQQLSYTTIRAPYSGVISERHVQVGETLAPGQAIFGMNSPTQLRVRIDLPQTEALALQKTRSTQILLDDSRKIPVQSIVVFPNANPDTHTVTLRLSLPAGIEGLKPGMSVKVLLPSTDEANFSIPVTALLVRSEVISVYVVQEKTIRLRQIRIGRRVGNQVQVLSGLHAGELIAADALATSLRLSEQAAE
jgi:RND family efflux transporter MFP subunit